MVLMTLKMIFISTMFIGSLSVFVVYVGMEFIPRINIDKVMESISDLFYGIFGLSLVRLGDSGKNE
ncbi:hypothetical protein HK407_02g03780 [Ordospora pajunii]|uniref:uncharacterized protein n=1 Tax=Ordospora pajunii TaxID=3039483 RepID=UPI0029527038|nr:uncharacterized protein HK407_02g03780 [Ordospora pajunii]KAH9411932.1 hypothetical protein HK407_02g03780 [Ordospora pajunii]